MNTIILGTFTAYDPPAGGRQTNCFCMHSGAANFGLGRFLMLRSDYDLLDVSSTADGIVTLTMTSTYGPGKSSVVQIPVVLAGCVPYSVASDHNADGDNSAKDFVEAVVYDLRYYMQAPVNKAYNCGMPVLFTSTLSGGTAEWTWTNAIADLGFDVLGWPSLPSWNPRQLIFDQVPTGRAIDYIAESLRDVVGFNYASSGAGSMSSLSAYVPGSMDPANAGQITAADAYKISGRASIRETKKLPSVYRCVFKVYDASSSDPYANRYYTKDVAGSGSGSYTYVIPIGEWTGLRVSGVVSNSATLDLVATDVAARTQAQISVVPDEATYVGWWPFFPDGAIRGVRWWSSDKGAFTTIRINSDRAFMPIDDARRSLIPVSNQLVLSVGLSQCAMGLAGARIMWPTGGSSGGWGTLTGHSGAFPQWLYTLTLNGSTLTAYNGCETPGSPPYVYGNGVLITSSSGQANSTACVIQPIGSGAVVWVAPNGTGSIFSTPNSAQ